MSSKITIIGAGSVGATIAYTLSNEEIASEIVLIDINEEKVEERFWILPREPVSVIRSPLLPGLTRMPRILILSLSHQGLLVNLDRLVSNLHRPMSIS